MSRKLFKLYPMSNGSSSKTVRSISRGKDDTPRIIMGKAPKRFGAHLRRAQKIHDWVRKYLGAADIWPRELREFLPNSSGALWEHASFGCKLGATEPKISPDYGLLLQNHFGTRPQIDWAKINCQLLFQKCLLRNVVGCAPNIFGDCSQTHILDIISLTNEILASLH